MAKHFTQTQVNCRSIASDTSCINYGNMVTIANFCLGLEKERTKIHKFYLHYFCTILHYQQSYLLSDNRWHNFAWRPMLTWVSNFVVDAPYKEVLITKKRLFKDKFCAHLINLILHCRMDSWQGCTEEWIKQLFKVLLWSNFYPLQF